MLKLLNSIVTSTLVMAAFVFVSTAYAGKMELTTYYPAPYGEYKQVQVNGSDTTDNTVALRASGSDTANPGLAVTNANRVGVGTASPDATLDVRGQIRSVSSNGSVFTTTGTNIDWNNGNVIVTSANPGALVFSNMQAGGAYTLIVTNATAGTYTFSQAGITSWKFAPANGATTASKTTIYTFIRAGDIVYVSWIPNF